MYCFYRTEYNSCEIPEQEFPEMIAKAKNWLEKCKRIYSVSETDSQQEKMALCAVAEGIYLFCRSQRGEFSQKMSIGSVSCTTTMPEIANTYTAKEKELLQRAGMYLDICRCARKGTV